MVILDQFQDILLVSFGAVLGVNFRFIIYEKLKKFFLINDFAILIINTFSSFLLGIFLSIVPRISSYDFSYKLILFFSIGLLGSLSTFSTFVYEICNTFLEFKFFSALRLFFISMFLGIISLAFGLYLGNQ